MEKLISYFIITMLMILLSILSINMNAQTVISLDEILVELRTHAFSIKEAKSHRDVAMFNNRFYHSTLKPQLRLDAILPDFTNSTSEVRQPNGGVSFQQITQNSGFVSLSATQEISLTGGQLFAQSNLQRFDDFNVNTHFYNGVPFRIGLIQPLFGYNPHKYNKKIQTLLLSESRRKYNIDVENAQLAATKLYFEVLITNENQKIAQANKEVNEQLLNITKEKYELGKVSKDEYLQLKIAMQNAILDAQKANFSFENSISLLYTLIGKVSPKENLTLLTPEVMNALQIDVDFAIQALLLNRPEILEMKRRIIEEEDNVARQKSIYGVQTNLIASYGLASASEELSPIYTDPFAEQQIKLSVSMPIFDWGKRKSVLAIAKLKHQTEKDRMKQFTLALINRVKQIVIEFMQLQTEIVLIQSIMTHAKERAHITNERYILGDISITEMTLAQREKNQIQRNYIQALKKYWVNYYEIRALTAYDFVKNENIIYP